jgi:membrane protein DedA with SNARE-associated domain
MDPLANLVDWIGSYGVFGLFAIGLVERFVPALPSHGVLVAIGIAVAGETWSLPAAFIVTTFGHICACMTLYMLVRALGLKVANRFLFTVGRFCGLTPERIDTMLETFKAGDRVLSFVAQIIPGIRHIAPFAAGLLRLDFWRFASGAFLGIALWNCSFITAGYVAAQIIPDPNASVLAIKFLLLILVLEAMLALILRVRVRNTGRRRISAEDGAC